MLKRKVTYNLRSSGDVAGNMSALNDHNLPEVKKFINHMLSASGADYQSKAFHLPSQHGHSSLIMVRLTDGDEYKTEHISHHVVRSLRNIADGRVYFGFEVYNLIQVVNSFCSMNKKLFSVKFSHSALVEEDGQNKKWVLRIHQATTSDLKLLFDIVSIMIDAFRSNEELFKDWNQVSIQNEPLKNQIHLFSTYLNNFLGLRGQKFFADNSSLYGQSGMHLMHVLSNINSLSELKTKLAGFNVETRMFLEGYEKTHALIASVNNQKHANDSLISSLRKKVVLD